VKKPPWTLLAELSLDIVIKKEKKKITEEGKRRIEEVMKKREKEICDKMQRIEDWV
jgi:hypothetical protein